MMAKSKMKKFLLVLAASATIALASCDDVEARMTAKQEAEPILVDKDGNNPDIYNNEMREIYDALITSGDTNSEKVLNNILLVLAESKYGSFYDKNGETGLLSLKGKTDDEIYSFVTEKKHEIYKVTNSDGSVNKDATVANVKDFINTLIVTINKSFWSTVKNSSYQERNYFIEELFYKAEKAELYDFSKVDDATLALIKKERKLVEGHDTYEDVDEYFHEGWMSTYQDYIERSILQSAYRKALVESYLISNNYGVLGRSYARKVQYVAIKDENGGDHLGSLYRLFHTYAKYILEKSDEEIANLSGATGLTEEDYASFRDLRFLDSLYIGYFSEDEQSKESYMVAQWIYDMAGFTPSDTSNTAYGADGTTALSVPFYKETKYGKLVLDYGKQADNRWKSSESSTDFTNSNAYTKETGFKIEEDSIRTTNNVTTGWYTSSGLSDLASDFKTRLFKMNVANELDTEPNSSVMDEIGRDDGKYTTRLKADGKYYLMPETYDDASADATPYVLYDSSSTTWYIIRIDEAVKASKLVKDGINYYDTVKKDHADWRSGSETANQIVWEVAGLLGDSDTYKKAANQHYVEEAAISYHDQDVYDYFEKTFPDLFD